MTVESVDAGILVSALLVAGALFCLRRSSERGAHDVFIDLQQEPGEKIVRRNDRYRKTDLTTDRTRSILAGALTGAFLSLMVSSLSSIFALLSAGAATGAIISEGRSRRRAQRQSQNLDYYLPIVMERIVMAVEAGLDIIPAIEVVVTLERAESAQLDPVTELFGEISRYTDSGLRFSDALSLIEAKVDRPAFKHALVHLGLAHQEGGEIIHPLRELSDATQLHFQEAVEEEIAKMPIKATLPLLCTFGGLIVSFLTAPLVQVMMITSQAVPR